MIKENSHEIKVLIENMRNIQSEVSSLAMRLKFSSAVLPFTTAGLSWTGSPVRIGWISSTSGVQSFPLPSHFPSDASMVRIIAFHRSGDEGPSREALYRLWTEVDGQEHVHFLLGWRYQQDAISFQAPEYRFPIDPKNRVIKASTNSIQPAHANDHGVFLYVSGY